LHPARPAVSARLRSCGDPDDQPWETDVQGRRGRRRQIIADQAQVQVPALRAAVGPLDPGRDDARVARRDDPPGRQPIQAGAYRPHRQAGVADQRGHRRERARAVRPGMIGQANEHELAHAGRLPATIRWDRRQVQRPRDRFDAHRASLLSRAACGGPLGPLSQFLSHSPPSGTVHRGSPRACLRSSRTVADASERGTALLESVLGATPREFESRILRHVDLR
jgi:hypothetical protein